MMLANQPVIKYSNEYYFLTITQTAIKDMEPQNSDERCVVMNTLKKLKSKFGFKSLNDVIRFGVQFLKFGIVGASNTVISLVIYYALVYLGVNYILSYAIGFVIGIFNSYFWNSRFVFKKREKGNYMPFIKMTVANLFALLLNLGALYIMVNFIGISDKIAPVINLCLVTPINFLLNKLWAFK